MKPLLILVLVPVLIGMASNTLFHGIRSATLAAAIGAPVVVFACFRWLDPGSTWGWLAALLVSPLVMSFALVTVMVWFGRHRTRKRSPGNHA